MTTALPLAICADHLRLLGERAEALTCTILADESGADEVLVQAASGLMAVHGGELGVPRRLGLDVVSVATGTLAAQGMLAASFARMRGAPVREVRTSPLHGALAYLHHHLAIATSGGSFPFSAATDGTGPPFRTADGSWVELEAMSGDTWVAFWKLLGVDEREAGKAWLPFVYRYLAGRCALPTALHLATQCLTLDALIEAASSSGLAACRVRRHDEATESVSPWTLTAADRADARRTSNEPTVDAPLGGIRVVEVTSRLQGPLAGQLLRRLGAEVIKVEPRGGDFGRCSPPFAGTRGAAYVAYNHGKIVEELDYKQPADRARLLSLVAESDVFLHNWPRGRAEREGLDFASLSKRNPRIVYAHAAGWDRAMPEPVAIAGDQLVQAHAGCGDLLSPAEEPPVPSRLTIVDTMGGLLATEAVLAALCVRERSGCGVAAETSLFGGAMMLRGDARGRPAWDWRDRPIPTADGFLIARATSDAHREKLASLPFGARSAEGWIGPLAKVGIRAGVVRTDLARIPDDWKHGGVVEHLDDGCWVPTTPWSFSA